MSAAHPLYRILLTAVFGLLLVSCSVQHTAGGGGTEAGNADALMGAVFTRDGVPASATQVILIDSAFDPRTDAFAGRCRIDTTDAEGEYAFLNVPYGTYSIEAKSLVDGTRLLQTSLYISSDTCIAKTDTLKQPGTLVIIDSTLRSGLWVVVPGTSISRYFGGQVDTVLVDSLPAELLPLIEIVYLTGTVQTTDTLAGSIMIPEGGTYRVNATAQWTLVPAVDSAGILNVVSMHVNDAHSMTRLCMHPDGSSRLYLSSPDSTVEIIDSANLILGPSAQPYGVIHTSFPAYEWVATQDGIGYVSGKHVAVFSNRSHGTRAPDSLRGDLFSDRNGNVWIAYNDGQTSRWNYSVWKSYSLPSPHALYVDAGAGGIEPDTLWAASTDSGLVRMIDTVLTVYNPGNSALIDKRIHSLSADAQGNLWLAAPTGLYRFDKNTAWEHYTNENSPLPVDDVRKVIVDSSNAVWAVYGALGDQVCGAAKLDGTVWTIYDCRRLPGFIPGRHYISDITVDSNGDVWIAVWGLGVFGIAQ